MRLAAASYQTRGNWPSPDTRTRDIEPMGTGGPEIDGQLQFERIAGYLRQLVPGAGDDRQIPDLR